MLELKIWSLETTLGLECDDLLDLTALLAITVNGTNRLVTNLTDSYNLFKFPTDLGDLSLWIL
jgi:hypothetical protein